MTQEQQSIFSVLLVKVESALLTIEVQMAMVYYKMSPSKHRVTSSALSIKQERGNAKKCFSRYYSPKSFLMKLKPSKLKKSSQKTSKMHFSHKFVMTWDIFVQNK